MKRPSRPLVTVVFSIAALCLALACGEGKPPYLETVAQTPYLALPTTTRSLVSIDIRRLTLLEDTAKLRDNLQEQIQFYSTIRDRVGIDLLEDIDLMIVGSHGAPEPTNPLGKSIFIMRGNFPEDPAPMLEALRQWLGKEVLISPEPYKQIQHAETDYKIFRTKGRSQYDASIEYELNFCSPDPRLLVFTFDSTLMRMTLDVVAGLTGGIGQDEFWKQMLLKPNIGAVLWSTGELGAKNQAFDQVAPQMQLTERPEQFFYSLNLLGGLDFEAGLVCAEIAQAENLTEQLRKGVEFIKSLTAFYALSAPKLAELPDRITIVTEQTTAKIYLRLPEVEMQQIARELERLQETATSGTTP